MISSRIMLPFISRYILGDYTNPRTGNPVLNQPVLHGMKNVGNEEILTSTFRFTKINEGRYGWFSPRKCDIYHKPRVLQRCSRCCRAKHHWLFCSALDSSETGNFSAARSGWSGNKIQRCSLHPMIFHCVGWVLFGIFTCDCFQKQTDVSGSNHMG